MPRAVLAPTLKFTRSSENEQPVAKYLKKKSLKLNNVENAVFIFFTTINRSIFTKFFSIMKIILLVPINA